MAPFKTVGGPPSFEPPSNPAIWTSQAQRAQAQAAADLERVTRDLSERHGIKLRAADDRAQGLQQSLEAARGELATVQSAAALAGAKA